MMQAHNHTYYFSSVDKAEDAASELEDAGYTADVHAENATGERTESFVDRVREFFGGAPEPGHESGALLTVSGDGSGDVHEIVRKYDGRERDTSSGDALGADTSGEQRLRLGEERLNVDKQQVQDGDFRVRKEVVTEHQDVDVPVSRDEVYVERRPVTDSGDATIGDDTGDDVRIPVTHEELEVTKRPVTTEEIVVGKRRVEETQTVGADLRKERAQFDSDVDVDESNVRDTTDR